MRPAMARGCAGFVYRAYKKYKQCLTFAVPSILSIMFEMFGVLLTLLGHAQALPAAALEPRLANGLALTPPMGYICHFVLTNLSLIA